MAITAYTINDLCELFEMSRSYFYSLVKTGKGPVLSGDGTHPKVKLLDALVFGEDRARATSESYRGRWEAGIRRIRIDMVLSRNAQANADALARAKDKQAKLNEYEDELAAYEDFKERHPTTLRKRPVHPFEKNTERSTGRNQPADWLTSVSFPTAR